MSRPENGWNEWTKQYSDIDEYSQTRVCPNCELSYGDRDHHGIEDCIKSLAQRVRILFEKK
jgi:imidazoleglycerol phosphate dehydratase HisB